MPWYYNGGNISRPVKVKPGVTVAVKPHTKVEIITMTPEAQALIRKGIFRRTGKPRGAKAVPDVPKDEPKIEDVVQKSDMARKIAEKGVTSSRFKPPKPVKGKKAEMTEGEENAGAAKKDAEKVEVLSNAASADESEKKK